MSSLAIELGDEVSYLRQRCEHVVADSRLSALGYRFHPFTDSELPPVFVRRFETGSDAAAITLLAGIDPDSGEGVLDDSSAAEAERRIAAGDAGIWTVRLTFGARMLSIDDLCALRHRDPGAFACIAGELRLLEPTRRSMCRLCRAWAADAP